MRKLKRVFAAALSVLCAAGMLTGCLWDLSPAGSSSSSSQTAQTANPWVECVSVADAERQAGFQFNLPNLPKEMGEPEVSVVKDEMIQVIYKVQGQELRLRKGKGTEDISGNYSEFDTQLTQKVNGVSVTFKGNDGKFSLATWTKDGFAYSVDSSAAVAQDAAVQAAKLVMDAQ